MPFVVSDKCQHLTIMLKPPTCHSGKLRSKQTLPLPQDNQGKTIDMGWLEHLQLASVAESRLAERGDYMKTASRSEATTLRSPRGARRLHEDRLAERGDYIKIASRSEATTLITP